MANYESDFAQHGAAPKTVPSTSLANNLANSLAAGLASCRTTISVEFVARPNDSQRAHAQVPAAIISTLEGIAGFAGCAVMASSQEERLITVLTFWQGDLSPSAAATNVRWICKLMERYMDHRLRVQTMRTRLAITSSKQIDPGLEEPCVPVA